MVIGICVLLFVFVNCFECFVKVVVLGVDVVIFDFEDVVVVDVKDVVCVVLVCDFIDLLVIVCINVYGMVWYDVDVVVVVVLQFVVVILFKVEDVVIIVVVVVVLDLLVIVLIESVLGLVQVWVIVQVMGVVWLVFGLVDFCVDLGCVYLCEVLLFVWLELVLVLCLVGIEVLIDGVMVQLDDLVISYDDVVYVCVLGMIGKLCIYFRQIVEVCCVFVLMSGEIDWVWWVLVLGDGVVLVEGVMVDEFVCICVWVVLV